MKGVILAGGEGSRMGLFTRRCGNKHVIPVYNRPMIEFPLSTFSQAGIDELAIVTSNHHAGDLCKLIGNGQEFGFKNVQYYVQVGEGGIADALKLVEPFVGDDKFAVILGDNIFEMNIKEYIQLYTNSEIGCSIFIKEVHDPNRFGVAEIDNNGFVSTIEEKPAEPKSNYAITGLYFFDKHVFEICKQIRPSERGELEISDVLKSYLNNKNLISYKLDGYWSDAGTFESCYESSTWVRENNDKLIKNGRFAKYRFERPDGAHGIYYV